MRMSPTMPVVKSQKIDVYKRQVYYSDTFGYENQLDIIEKLPNSLTGDVIYPIAALKGDSLSLIHIFQWF